MERKKYSNFPNVDKWKNEIVPEEFPDGPLGSPINQDKPVENKSTPWKEEQKQMSSFDYPDEKQHAEVPRQFEGADWIHDERGDRKEEEEK